MIIYTNVLVPKAFDAVTVWPFIFIRPTYKNDEPLKQHELVHYREQAWITPIWFLRYALSKSFRVQAEARAYKVQISLSGLTIESASTWLMKYDASLTRSQAISLLIDS